MKKSTVITMATVGLGLGGAALLGGTADASTWVAKTPNEIGSLNENGTYTVQQGDTIWAIGVHFNIKPHIIEEVNGITNPYNLQIGTVLKLHLDKEKDTATIEATTPSGTRSVTLKPSDKLVPSKKFGEDVSSDIHSVVNHNDLESHPTNQYQEGAVQQSKVPATQQGTTVNTTTQQNINPEVLATLAYYDIYEHNGNDGIDKNYQIVKVKPHEYALYQGGSSSAYATVNGDTVTIHAAGIDNTYTAKELINQYYNTDAQRQKINSIVNTGVNGGKTVPSNIYNTNSNSKNSSTNEAAIAMVAYCNSYYSQGDQVESAALQMSGSNGTYYINQGANPAKVVVDGDNVILYLDAGQGKTKVVKESVRNITNKYYSTDAEKQNMNHLVNIGRENYNKKN